MTKQAVLLVASGPLPVDSTAISQAVEQAQAVGGRLHFLYVYDELRWPAKLNALGQDVDTVKETLVTKAKHALLAQVGDVADIDVTDCSVRFGHVFIEAIHYCQQHAITMIVKAAKKPGWASMFLGSEDLHLLRKSPVPVWLTVPRKQEPIKSVAVALDFDHDEEPESRHLNKQLLCQAIATAKMKKATLHLINVYNIHGMDFATLWADDPGTLEKELLEDEKVSRQAAMQGLISEINEETPHIFDTIKYTIHLIEGTPSERIAQTTAKLASPLLVMGCVGRSGVAGLFIGNTAESTLLQIQCPILIMKPEGFVSPVGQ